MNLKFQKNIHVVAHHFFYLCITFCYIPSGETRKIGCPRLQGSYGKKSKFLKNSHCSCNICVASGLIKQVYESSNFIAAHKIVGGGDGWKNMVTRTPAWFF